ncbi:MAG: FdhF/YdeP family oxidoreductase [Flavobacteriales bacterium]|nr:FdhF/YdeP family oxidoreductase [Flavobacteriales bacterium]
MNRRSIRLLPPDRHTGLALVPKQERAAGLPALVRSLAHVQEETGVLNGISILNKLNQKDGFDCPGCAWPDPAHRSRLGEYCENGVKAIAEEGTTKRVDRAFFAKHSVEELSHWSDYELGKAGRLTEPFILRAGSSHYEPMGWSEALAYAAQHLSALSSPNEAVFYTSGRASNEAAYLYQLFVRRFGTNNLPDCSNMCHESSGVGLNETIGVGKGTVSLDDLHNAGLIIVMGQNPGTNHPRMLSALTKCVENGGRVVSVNPLPEAGTQRFVDPQSPLAVLRGGSALSSLHIGLRINTDVALLKGVMRLLLEREEARPGTVFDRAFIADRTEGHEAFIAELRNIDVQEMADTCGITLQQFHELADLICGTDRIIITWAMGLTQHVNAVANIRQVVNLLLLRGAFGKPGAGACPVRGHSNVQGDRTMGIYEKPTETFLQALDGRYQFTAPRSHGYDVVDCIEAMHAGRAKVFIALGGNFISATPDSEVTAKAMMTCALTVQISTKLNRSHVITGEEALILPCLGRSERDMPYTLDGVAPTGAKPQFVTVEDSMSVVHRSQGAHEPASPYLRSEPWIVCGLADATLKEHPSLRWKEWARDHDRIREEIEAVIPGFKDFNKRVRTPDGFVLPNDARDGARFTTGTGKASFSVDAAPAWNVPKDRFMMMTIRTHDQFNTTIYGLDDHYRGIHGERRVVLMHADDMSAMGLAERERVDLVSNYERERVATDFFVLPYAIAKGCVATYFPEANVLVPLHLKAEKSGTPASKSVVISIRRR